MTGSLYSIMSSIHYNALTNYHLGKEMAICKVMTRLFHYQSKPANALVIDSDTSLGHRLIPERIVGCNTKGLAKLL